MTSSPAFVPRPRAGRTLDAVAAALTFAALLTLAADLRGQGPPGGGNNCPETRADPTPPLCPGQFSPCQTNPENGCPSPNDEDDPPGCDKLTGDHPLPVAQDCVGYPPDQQNTMTECVPGTGMVRCTNEYWCYFHPGIYECRGGDTCGGTITTVYKETVPCNTPVPPQLP